MSSSPCVSSWVTTLLLAGQPGEKFTSRPSHAPFVSTIPMVLGSSKLKLTKARVSARGCPCRRD